MNIEVLTRTMLVMFGMLLVGYLAGKTGLMTEEMNRHLSAFSIAVTNPLQVLSSVLSGGFPMTNLEVLKLTGLAFCGFAVLIGLSFILRLFPRIEPDKRRVMEFLFVFANIGCNGYPLVEAAFGSGATFYVTVFVLAFQLVCWTWGVFLLSGGKGELSFRLFLTPCIIAAVIAYILYFFRVPCPELVYRTVYNIGNMSPALVMLILGCSLACMKLGDIFGRFEMYLLVLVRLVAVPLLLGLLMKHLIPNNPVMLQVAVLILCMPAATNTTVMSYRYAADQKTASAGVFLSTLLSVGTIPLVMSILFR